MLRWHSLLYFGRSGFVVFGWRGKRQKPSPTCGYPCGEERINYLVVVVCGLEPTKIYSSSSSSGQWHLNGQKRIRSIVPQLIACHSSVLSLFGSCHCPDKTRFIMYFLHNNYCGLGLSSVLVVGLWYVTRRLLATRNNWCGRVSFRGGMSSSSCFRNYSQ